MKNIEQEAEEALNRAMSTCHTKLETFRLKNSEVIGQLIKQSMFDDLFKIIHKRGFADGMAFSRAERDKL